MIFVNLLKVELELEPVVSVVGVLPDNLPGQADVSLHTLQLQPGLLHCFPANINIVETAIARDIKYFLNNPCKQEHSLMNSDLNAII